MPAISALALVSRMLESGSWPFSARQIWAIHSGFQRAKKHPQLGVFFFQAFGNLFLAPQHMEKHCQYAEKAKKYEKHC